MKKRFNNEIVDSLYWKYNGQLKGEYSNGYFAFMESLEIFDKYIDEVRKQLNEHVPTKILTDED